MPKNSKMKSKKKEGFNKYQELELADEIDIVSVDTNGNKYGSDIYIIFGGDETNTFVEMED